MRIRFECAKVECNEWNDFDQPEIVTRMDMKLATVSSPSVEDREFRCRACGQVNIVSLSGDEWKAVARRS